MNLRTTLHGYNRMNLYRLQMLKNNASIWVFYVDYPNEKA